MTSTPEEQAIAAALAQAERDVACGINPSGEPLRVALHKAMDVIKATSADLAALRIEHEAVCGLLTHTRRDRDEARAQVADLQRLGASIHKAADAARRAERADAVAWLHTDGPALAFASCIGGSEYTCAAAAIGRGEHEGAATPK